MNTSRYLKTFFLLVTLTFLFSCSKLPQIPTQMTMESTMGSIEHKGNLSGLQVASARLPTLPAPEAEPPSSISSSVSSSTSPSPSTSTLTSRPEGELSQAFQEKASQLKLLARSKESRDYVLGPRDIIKITVWGHEDLTRQVTISQEGSFSYPFIGDVVAEKKTAAQLEQEIAQRLDVRFIINPQVNISIEAYKSKIAYVIGEVVRKDNKESGFPLIGQTTIFEILSQAGGPTPAAGSEVLVIRPSTQLRKSNPLSPDQAQNNEIITINLWKLMVGDQTQNIYLESGDTVYVPKAEYFYVYGEVKSPGKFNLEKGANILKGIAIAGGATEKAALSRTKLVRERDGIRIEINKVKLDELIQTEDIIMIPESFF